MEVVPDHVVSQKVLMVVVIVSITWSCSCLPQSCHDNGSCSSAVNWCELEPFLAEVNTINLCFTVLSVTVQTVLLKVQLSAVAGRKGEILKLVSLTEKEKRLVVEKERTFCW